MECSVCGWELEEEEYRCEECGAIVCVECLRIEGEMYYCHGCWQERYV